MCSISRAQETGRKSLPKNKESDIVASAVNNPQQSNVIISEPYDFEEFFVNIWLNKYVSFAKTHGITWTKSRWFGEKNGVLWITDQTSRTKFNPCEILFK